MIQQSHFWAYIWKNKIIRKETCMPIFRSTIYNSQDMEATQVPINRWIVKIWYIYINMMEYFSAIKKSEILPFAATQMDLDNMLSEIIQRKTNIIWYHLYVDSKRNNTNECVQLKNNNNRLIDWKNKLVLTKGEAEERGVWVKRYKLLQLWD